MAAYIGEFSIYRGEQKTWELTITSNGSPIDISSADIRFVVRATVPSGAIADDSTAIFAKTVGAGVTIVDGPNGICDVEVEEADTASLSPTASSPLRYFYGIEMDGAAVLAQGPFIITYDIVRGI